MFCQKEIKMEHLGELEYFVEELKEFNYQLDEFGLPGALRFLNYRTPHRYTGLYKFNGDVLSNLVKYDPFKDELIHDDDVPLDKTYCSLVQKKQALEIIDSSTDNKVKNKIDTPVISYCGVLMQDEKGNPYGTLCHFDMNRCEECINDFPLLQSAAQTFYEFLRNENY